MEPDVVEPVLFDDAEIAQPALNVYRRETREWENTGIVLAAKLDRLAVDLELHALRCKLAQAERRLPHIAADRVARLRVELDRQRPERRLELVPRGRVWAAVQHGLDDRARGS